MKHFLFSLIFLLLISVGAVGTFLFLDMQNKTTTTTKIETNIPKIDNNEEKDEEKVPVSSQEVQDRLSILRNRVHLKDLIKNGDTFLQEKNYMPAILNYQKALQQSPEDKGLIKKIADTYYEMHNFKKSYEYYGKIKNDGSFDSEKFIFSMVNYKGILPVNIKNLKKEIESLKISKEEKYYYTTSLDCALNYKQCEQEFETFFSLYPDISYKKLATVKQAFVNYKNFQSKEEYYKATYLSSAFYENGFYYIAIKTAEKVEGLKSGYQPVLKIAALSAYAIWKYEIAKDYLLRLKKINSNDPEISYLTARVYERLNEKSLALVHYEKAMTDGYKNQTEILRRMMFIYFEHKEQQKMLEIFDKILKQDAKNITSTDYSLSIYYNILYNHLGKAKLYARKASMIYKNIATFQAYQAWIMLLKKDFNDAELKIIEKRIQKAESISKSDTLTLMVRGILEYYKKNNSRAMIYLKKASKLDTSWEYKEEIDHYLNAIQNIENPEN